MSENAVKGNQTLIGDFQTEPSPAGVKRKSSKLSNPVLKGVVKQRAKGRTYYYAWKGGPRVRGEPGTKEFLLSLAAAHEQEDSKLPGGVRPKCEDDSWNVMKPPLIGVYLLIPKGQIVYLGW
jgi:hypothetical protein